jgi:hypothetical protein
MRHRREVFPIYSVLYSTVTFLLFAFSGSIYSTRGIITVYSVSHPDQKNEDFFRFEHTKGFLCPARTNCCNSESQDRLVAWLMVNFSRVLYHSFASCFIRSLKFNPIRFIVLASEEFTRRARSNKYRVATAISLASLGFLYYQSSRYVLCSGEAPPAPAFQIRDEVVERYVQCILKDPNLNIYHIPDKLESQIYHFTVKMTLNAILSWVGMLNGLKILGHRLELRYVAGTKVPQVQFTGLNQPALRQFVASLLKEKAVNVGWLPDSVEQKIYFNCLLIMFTVLQTSLTSLRIHVVGHRISIGMESINLDDVAYEFRRRKSGVSGEIIDRIVEDMLTR